MVLASQIENTRELWRWIRICRESLLAVAQSRAFLATLCFVALVDGVLLGLGLATVYADAEEISFPTWFYLSEEFSFGEIWEYLVSAAAAAGLLWRYRVHREPIIGCLGIIFVWLTLDNSLAIHEAVGHMLSPLFAFAEYSHPNPDDYGELVAFGFVAVVILFELFVTGLRSSAQSVIQSLAIIAMLGAAAVFGVVVDFADHMFANPSPLMKGLLSLIEDGSEMVLLSIAAVIAMTARAPASQS